MCVCVCVGGQYTITDYNLVNPFVALTGVSGGGWWWWWRWPGAAADEGGRPPKTGTAEAGR